MRASVRLLLQEEGAVADPDSLLWAVRNGRKAIFELIREKRS